MSRSTLDKLRMRAPKRPRTAAVVERERGQLTRLERVVDVLYALALFQTIALLPQPTAAELDVDGGLALGMWNARDEFLMPIVGIGLVLIYWGQNNLLFGNLDRTDERHAASAVFQVTFVMLFGYFIRMGAGVGDRSDILAAQSVCLLLAGLAAISGWRYAQRHGLLDPDGLSGNEIQALGQRISVEPTVAAITIPIAWLGPLAYTLTFLLGIPIVSWLFRLFTQAPSEEEPSP